MSGYPEEFPGINPKEMMDISRLKKSNKEYTFIHDEAK
jgi:hypothetical protein